MTALERIKEIEKDITGPWADVEEWDEDHQFLLQAFKVMREIAWELLNGQSKFYGLDDEDLDNHFEEQMQKDLTKKQT